MSAPDDEFPFYPIFAVYKFIAFYFNFLDKARNQYSWFKTHKNMNVIGYAVSCCLLQVVLLPGFESGVVMYLCNSSSLFFDIRLYLSLTAKTN